MSLLTIINEQPRDLRIRVLRSLVGTMNNSIIGYLSSYIRQSPEYQRLQEAEDEGRQLTIDDLNDAEAETEDKQLKNKNTEEIGFETPIDPLEMATRIGEIRNHLAAVLQEDARNQYEEPFSLENSLDWRIQNEQPAPKAAIAALAAATGISEEHWLAAHKQRAQATRAFLEKHRETILELADSFASEGDDTVEAAFDRLPAPTQVRYAAKAVNAAKAYKSFCLQRILSGNSETLGELPLIDAFVQKVKDFVEQQRKTGRWKQELDAYEARAAIELPEVA